ncbi:MAG: DUF454 domain-containing protein, partial [bacterium]|nr:DUF454 domain-containing protein [bacterium]
TTPFLLLAAACYFRSSKKFYDWLLSNKWLGHYIKDYREKRGISLKVKIISITLLWVTISLSGLFATSLLWVRLLLLAVATGVTIHLTRLKTLKKVPKV